MTKKHRKKFFKKLMNGVHHIYHVVQDQPAWVKYGTATLSFLLGLVGLMNPLIPGWILLGLGIGLFSPRLYKKYVGRHVRSHKFDILLELHGNKIRYVLTENSKKAMKKLYKKTLAANNKKN